MLWLDDQQLTAAFLKKKNGKWEGKQSSKQSKKIRQVKQVLGEVND